MSAPPGLSPLELLAPCGIDCRLCRAYQRPHKPCPGCRGPEENQSKSCRACALKNCPARQAGGWSFCDECPDFPCARLAHLDQRYRTRYALSPLEDLGRLREIGLQAFAAEQARRWACPACGASLCMHKPECPACGRPR